MKCGECDCCRLSEYVRWNGIKGGFLPVAVYECTGVREPFEITDLNQECTEYKDKQEEKKMPNKYNLNALAKEVNEYAKAHGWWDEPRSFGDIIALCHSELSESLEEYRNHKPVVYFVTKDTDVVCTDLTKWNGEKLEGIGTELADCIIRIMDYCGGENIDIETILQLKHEYNKSRPYRHGGKKI